MPESLISLFHFICLKTASTSTGLLLLCLSPSGEVSFSHASCLYRLNLWLTLISLFPFSLVTFISQRASLVLVSFGLTQNPHSLQHHTLAVTKIFKQTIYSRFFCSHTYSIVSIRKLTGRNPSLHEIMAECGFFIQPL